MRKKYPRRPRRNFKSKNRRDIGERRGTSSSLRDIAVNDEFAVDSRTVYFSNLTTLQEGYGNNVRLRDVVYIKGFNITLQLENLSAVPLYWNIAVLSPKNAGANPGLSEFFRSYGVVRAVDFNASLSGLDMATRPINTDKWAILSHVRKKLAGAGGTYTNNYQDTISTWSRYIKLSRQLRFNGEDVDPQQRVYLVQWLTKQNSISGSEVEEEIAGIQSKVWTFFANGKEG